MRKIYDCITFFNELEVLEVRLQELYNYVDYFVIAEANTTHAGNSKPFNLLNNWEKIKPYSDKIIYIKVEDMPGAPITDTIFNTKNGEMEIHRNHWPNELHQRNCTNRGLYNINDEDIVIISDLDEIPRGSLIGQIRNDYVHTHWAFRMPLFQYKFNYMCTTPLTFQVQSQAFVYKRLKNYQTISSARDYGWNWINRIKAYDDGNDLCLPHGGWHFTNMGSSERVAYKLLQFSHGKEDTIFRKNLSNSINVDKLISKGNGTVENTKLDIVDLDNYFPEVLLNNKEKFKEFILPNSGVTAMDKLKIIDMNSSLQY